MKDNNQQASDHGYLLYVPWTKNQAGCSLDAQIIQKNTQPADKQEPEA